MTGLELLKQCAWAATFILSAAFAASWVLRLAPAAWRHFLWTVVLAGLLILPAMVRAMPKWGLATAPAILMSDAVTMTPSQTAPAVDAPRVWSPILLGWSIGCTLMAARFLVGRLRVRRMMRQATEAGYVRELMDAAGGRDVRVLQSASASTPLALGIWRPVVVLPLRAIDWPVERLRTALLHEFMHVRRRDLAAQAIAQAACCLYWFHPLAWISARRLRREREQACDDAVLGSGIAAHEYAGHLVDSVRALRGEKTEAMAMAEPSLLEVRVRALLDSGRDRRPLNRAAAVAMVGALAVMLLPLAAFTVHAQAAVFQQAEPAFAPLETPKRHAAPQTTLALARTDVPAQQAPAGSGSLSGIIQDPSGGRIPNCTILAKSEDGVTEQTTSTDQVGAYQFPSLPAARYTLQARAPGFKVWTRVSLPVEANQTSTVNLNLEIGNVSETVTVTAARPAGVAAPAARPSDAAGAIRVGGMVQPAMVLRKVPPVYPEELRAQGISGTVHLAAIIGKQGYLTDIHPLGSPLPGLAAAAVEAASHWVYQPSMLNGEPVAVMTSIDITFELK